LGHKKHKKRFYTQSKPSPQYQPDVHHEHRNKMSTRMKTVVAFLSIVIFGGIAYWGFSAQGSQSPQPGLQVYPQTVAGKFYSGSTLSSDRTKANLPTTIVQSNKLTFVDLALESQTDEITYQGRTIPLSLYKGGKYLPLLIISTPSQKVITALRVCEPCGSFSFHIVEGRYLDCDTCHTRWDIEALTGISGSCPSYPPPKLPTSVASDITVDLSALGVQVAS
jgi:hypothetical protein